MPTYPEIEARRYTTEDETGDILTVVEWVRTERPLSGPLSKVKGGRSWTLLDGSIVNRIDDDTFQVLETDMILRKIR